MNNEINSATMGLVFRRLTSIEGRPITSMGDSAATATRISQAIPPYADLYGLLVKHKMLSLPGIYPFSSLSHL